jgi:hypothetical protein
VDQAGRVHPVLRSLGVSAAVDPQHDRHRLLQGSRSLRIVHGFGDRDIEKQAVLGYLVGNDRPRASRKGDAAGDERLNDERNGGGEPALSCLGTDSQGGVIADGAVDGEAWDGMAEAEVADGRLGVGDILKGVVLTCGLERLIELATGTRGICSIGTPYVQLGSVDGCAEVNHRQTRLRRDAPYCGCQEERQRKGGVTDHGMCVCVAAQLHIRLPQCAACLASTTRSSFPCGPSRIKWWKHETCMARPLMRIESGCWSRQVNRSYRRRTSIRCSLALATYPHNG